MKASETELNSCCMLCYSMIWRMKIYKIVCYAMRFQCYPMRFQCYSISMLCYGIFWWRYAWTDCFYKYGVINQNTNEGYLGRKKIFVFIIAEQDFSYSCSVL